MPRRNSTGSEDGAVDAHREAARRRRNWAQGAWQLDILEEQRFNGEDEDVRVFTEHLRWEVGRAVNQGLLVHKDEALSYLGPRQFTGMALDWLKGAVEEYNSLEDLLRACEKEFGKDMTPRERKFKVQTMKKLPTESSMAFSIRLGRAERLLPATHRLTEEERKHAFLEGHKRPSLLKRTKIRGKKWDSDDVTYKELVRHVINREDDDEDEPRGSQRDFERVAEQAAEKAAERAAEKAADRAAEQAAKQVKDSMAQDMAAMKKELRLTGVRHGRPGPQRVFLTEEGAEGLEDEEVEEIEAYIMDRRSGYPDRPRPQFPLRNSGPYRRPALGMATPISPAAPAYAAPQQPAPVSSAGDPKIDQLTQVVAQLVQCLTNKPTQVNTTTSTAVPTAVAAGASASRPCHNCGAMDHWAADCPNKKDNRHFQDRA
jgi:hypothetical protein